MNKDILRYKNFKKKAKQYELVKTLKMLEDTENLKSNTKVYSEIWDFFIESLENIPPVKSFNSDEQKVLKETQKQSEKIIYKYYKKQYDLKGENLSEKDYEIISKEQDKIDLKILEVYCKDKNPNLLYYVSNQTLSFVKKVCKVAMRLNYNFKVGIDCRKILKIEK